MNINNEIETKAAEHIGRLTLENIKLRSIIAAQQADNAKLIADIKAMQATPCRADEPELPFGEKSNGATAH